MKIEVVKQETYANCVKLTLKVSDSDLELSERFSFSHEQFEEDRWKNNIKNWFLKQKNKKVVELEGQSFEISE